MLKPMLAAACLLLSGAGAWADIVIEDAYLRTATPTARSGAIFLRIGNSGAEADRLIAAETDVARRVELHTHVEAEGGVMQMREVENGFEIPTGGHALERGGDHVMLMGLTRVLEDGDTVAVTLIFEDAGRVEIEVPVDRNR